MLSDVPTKHKKGVMCLMEETCVFMLHFGMNYSAVGHEFNVTESKIYNK